MTSRSPTVGLPEATASAIQPRNESPHSPPEGVLRWKLGDVRGVHTVRSLVAGNLVDEYWLKVDPAIVVRGGSMISDVVERSALTLRSAKSFPSGAAVIYSM
jgi:hypothetical protein